MLIHDSLKIHFRHSKENKSHKAINL
jgi:hypothetical protein